MNATELMQILRDNAYVRTGGSEQEYSCAKYIADKVSSLGGNAVLEPFEVPMAEMELAELTIDGVYVPCTGYLCAGSWDVEAPLYYLRDFGKVSLSHCKGKIVLLDSFVGYWAYQDLVDAGALGYITCNGSLFLDERDTDIKEQRSYVHKGNRMPAVNIHAADAVDIVKKHGKMAHIRLKQKEWTGVSHNVILDIPGETEDYIAVTAHYDSTPLSVGVYDNLSGCAGLLYLAEYFLQNPQHYGLRFIWTGSEERGLLGAKAYCADEKRIENCVLNINLDMIGCLMGKFISCVSAEEKMCNYLSAMSDELGWQNNVYQGIYSSDSTPFADKNVPAVSFARNALRSMAGYHDRYDILDVMSGEQMEEDFAFVLAFAKRMAAARLCPFEKKMPDNIRAKLDNYLGVKRMK